MGIHQKKAISHEDKKTTYTVFVFWLRAYAFRL